MIDFIYQGRYVPASQISRVREKVLIIHQKGQEIVIRCKCDSGLYLSALKGVFRIAFLAQQCLGILQKW